MSDQPIRLNVSAAIVRDGKVLVIEFDDESGVHYNLPGGGVDAGESLAQALKRECLEEASAEVEIGRLLLIWEYIPADHDFKFGTRHKVGHVFECRLINGSQPKMPKTPDAHQSGVKWIPLSEISESPTPRRHPLLPAIGADIVRALSAEGPVQIVNAD